MQTSAVTKNRGNRKVKAVRVFIHFDQPVLGDISCCDSRPSSAKWQALPPGAAQASSTVMPGLGDRSNPASCADASARSQTQHGNDAAGIQALAVLA